MDVISVNENVYDEDNIDNGIGQKHSCVTFDIVFAGFPLHVAVTLSRSAAQFWRQRTYNLCGLSSKWDSDCVLPTQHG